MKKILALATLICVVNSAHGVLYETKYDPQTGKLTARKFELQAPSGTTMGYAAGAAVVLLGAAGAIFCQEEAKREKAIQVMVAGITTLAGTAIFQGMAVR
jgi:hypothetical protein